jgi:GNAT superfamily N-acetyltransferase
MDDWLIERLGSDHERADFLCGKPPLDTFLKNLVTQYEKRRLGRTFVACAAGQRRVAGYYTLATGSFDLSCLPESVQKKLPRHPLPTLHLGRLAVDQSFRGRRLGETLLFHALRACLELSEKVGAYAVDVWAIDEDAAAFYRKYGFLPLLDDPLHLYLLMQTIQAMFGA